nr:PREDICTED: organic cation transporter protein-like [Bemisia tabaci]
MRPKWKQEPGLAVDADIGLVDDIDVPSRLSLDGISAILVEEPSTYSLESSIEALDGSLVEQAKIIENYNKLMFECEKPKLKNKVGKVYLENCNFSFGPGLDIPSLEKPPVERRRIADFDDILPYIGEFGRYQKLLFLCMIPFSFFVSFVYFTQIFITAVPENYWCHVPQLTNFTETQKKKLSIPKSGGEYDRCSMFNVNYNELLASGKQEADPSWPVVGCRHGWDYNFTEIPYASIAAQLNWVCDKGALPAIAQAMFFFGAILGGLLFGWIADRYGRIAALVGSNAVGFVGGVLTAFSHDFISFAFCRFLVGFAFDNCFTMMYILVLEYVGPKWRTFVANMSIAIFFTLASCLLPWIAYFIRDWRWIAVATSVPLLFAALTPFVVPESARWLISRGMTGEAVHIIKKFEKLNGKHVEPFVYSEFIESCERLRREEETGRNYSVLDLFKSPHLRKITLLLIVIWMLTSLVFDGHVRNISNFGLDLFITFTVVCATELPADILLTLTLDRFGRRWISCLSMVLGGVFSLLASAVSFGTVSASLAVLGRFSVNISYSVGLQYAAELLPTVVRAQGVAFIHIMGYVASILSPFIVYLGVLSPTLPFLVLGVFGIVGGFLALLLPETLNKDLPQTLADGEEFGKDQVFLEFPCLSRSSDGEDDWPRKTSNLKRSHDSQSDGSSLRASLRAEVYRSSMIRRKRKSRAPLPIEAGNIAI